MGSTQGYVTSTSRNMGRHSLTVTKITVSCYPIKLKEEANQLCAVNFTAAGATYATSAGLYSCSI